MAKLHEIMGKKDFVSQFKKRGEEIESKAFEEYLEAVLDPESLEKLIHEQENKD